MKIDPVSLTADLIRCPSVTPEEGGAIELLERLLEMNGFSCTRITRGQVSNLFAKWGSGKNGRVFGFNGHTDVVPVGDLSSWSVDPFGAEVKEGFLYGRGATDMKSGVAAFVAAAIDFVNNNPPDGSVIITITGDEEGDAEDGTVAILDWMKQNGEKIDHCLVGEPTSPSKMGEMMKIGRRGSMTAKVIATGVQGHSAYPDRAKNPILAMVKLLDILASHQLDTGTEHFDPSTLAITSVDTGNKASNVIPASTTATINIRFNDSHSGSSLISWLEEEIEKVSAEYGIQFKTDFKITGESFITPPGELSELISEAVKKELGVQPKLSTTGGTSDARFIKNICPVTEFGLVGKTMHAIDERVEINQINQLKEIYTRILEAYFEKV
ncbi:MAG: succinyl-diaminopimelate desuccinylase [Pseudomonadota bacterium]|nr:succinyl-diaminopimelate desuccinylase [Pseudomonadota bacterium]